MEIQRLHISLKETTLVDIAFRIEHSLALVGQSGSGKSLTLKALLGMLPDTMQLELELESPFSLKCGDTVAFVPQNPFTALSPLTKIKKQFFVEEDAVVSLMKLVELDPALLERYPSELSGGQLQRVVIAMALSTQPKLLLLDEPTTALDPRTREVIIALLKRLQSEMGFKMLFVTHDMQSATMLCEDICVIKSGEVVEQGKMKEVMDMAKSDYTKLLIDANFANREYRI